jgi:AMP phosphorylase
MKRKMKAKLADLETMGVKVVVLNKEDALDMDVQALDRLALQKESGKQVTAIANLTDSFVKPGEIGLFEETAEALYAKNKEEITVNPKEKPDSVYYIRKKLRGVKLSSKQIHAIIEDLMQDELSEVELTAWITATFIRGMDHEETIALTDAIVHSGPTLELNSGRVFDKHCVGGVAGNKTTMLIVPIVSSFGLTIPKTSSRAITSPAGTADSMEVLAPVSHKKEEIEKIVNKAHGCMVWGGAVNLASADDRLIRVRNPLSLDPPGMLLASILAKKKAVGATDVIIDIPIGEGSKILTQKEAETLAKQFKTIGNGLEMNVHSLITDGDHPIGMAVGPSIEAKEVLRILDGEPVSQELREKACQLAGFLLELGEAARPGKGRDAAWKCIEKGKAKQQMQKIIEAQGGNPEITPKDVALGDYSHTITSGVDGKIEHVDNLGISSIVRGAGAPKDKEAGMYLHVEEGTKVKKGDKLFTIYARSERKIDQALDVYQERTPISFSKIIIEKLY